MIYVVSELRNFWWVGFEWTGFVVYGGFGVLSVIFWGVCREDFLVWLRYIFILLLWIDWVDEILVKN